MAKIINLKSVKVSCSQCSLNQLCLPRSLSHEEFDALTSLVQRERSLAKGETLFDLGAPFTSLYAIRTGSIKVFLPTNSGEEQIVSFHMPGELLGFDGIGHDSHCCTAEALEACNICELPYPKIHELCLKLPSLSDHFMNLMSNEIAEEHAMMLTLAKKSAEERIAVFLLRMSARFHRRGFSTSQFNLTMSRHDIANYLGLAVETVSRIMTHLQDEGIIGVDRRFINIRDMNRLRILADVNDNTCQTGGEYAET